MQKTITVITVNESYQSIFSEERYTLNQHGGMWLTDQINAVNFRIRESKAGYQSEWHVAGDPTMIIVLAGAIKIELRNGDSQKFNAGEIFLAKDYLPNQMKIDEKHGHRGIIEGEDFNAVHIKLNKLEANNGN